MKMRQSELSKNLIKHTVTKTNKLTGCLAALLTLFCIGHAQAIKLMQTGDCSYSPGTPGQHHGKIFSWELYDNNKVVWTNNLQSPDISLSWLYDEKIIPEVSAGKLKSMIFDGNLQTPTAGQKRTKWNLSLIHDKELEDDLQSWALEDSFADNILKPPSLNCKVNDKPQNAGQLYDWFNKKNIKVTCYPKQDEQLDTKGNPVKLTPIQWSYTTGRSDEVKQSMRTSLGGDISVVGLNHNGVPKGISILDGFSQEGRVVIISQNVDLPYSGEWYFTGNWSNKGKPPAMMSKAIFEKCTVEEKLVNQ